MNHTSKKTVVIMKYSGNCILFTENLVEYVRQHRHPVDEYYGSRKMLNYIFSMLLKLQSY